MELEKTETLEEQLRKIELDSQDKLESEQNSAIKNMSNELLYQQQWICEGRRPEHICEC